MKDKKESVKVEQRDEVNGRNGLYIHVAVCALDASTSGHVSRESGGFCRPVFECECIDNPASS